MKTNEMCSVCNRKRSSHSLVMIKISDQLLLLSMSIMCFSISQFQFPISIYSQLQFFLKASVSKLKLPALVCRDGAPAGPVLAQQLHRALDK